MNKTEILEFLNVNPICYLATSENNRPHVRAMGMIRADEQGIIFQTVDGKDLPKQLLQNPNIEVCFHNREKNIQIRVFGKAGLVDDLELKKEIAEKRPFLKPWIEKNGFDAIPVFRIVDCTALIWTMATNLEPKEYIRL
ncbi:MAG: pyridoxamine 5'-phosphate oxidase family protein [Deltaproteobacteria bacterium]|nr:pyridoxamine 5'-phosphate oxidase family protein [Deltaproteobacteria bacterium]